MNCQSPIEAKISSPQMPSWSRSARRSVGFPAPGARTLLSSTMLRPSLFLLRYTVGSRRSNDWPSTWTVSNRPSSLFTDRGMRSASFGGRCCSQKSGSSIQCESPEFAQILSIARFPVSRSLPRRRRARSQRY